jgi:hypothetical protein
MTELVESDLDAYSRLAVPLILAWFPDWEPFAKISARPDGAGCVVDFNVPCPSSAAEAGLWLSTADEELSVGFHTHHNHFTDYEHRLNREQIEAGLQQASDIIEERIGVVSWYRGSAFAGSRSVELPHPATLPGFLEGLGNLPQILSNLADCDRITLRSWLGTYDRDEVGRRS